jgi:TrmH family RNA methyltransferase
MVVRPLDDLNNKIVRQVRQLLRSRSAREKAGQFVLEGPHLALEALQAEAMVRAVLYSPRLIERPDGAAVLRQLTGGSVRTVFVSDRVLDTVADVNTHQGVLVVAALALPTFTHLTVESWLLCDGIQDPGNLGTIVRSAAAFGFRVGILPGTVDPFNPKAVRASAGALFQARPAWISLDFSWPSELAVLAADGSAPEPYYTWAGAGPVALVIGNEGEGVHADLLARVTRRIAIPIEPGVESLNAAVAAALLMGFWHHGRKPGPAVAGRVASRTAQARSRGQSLR